MTESSMKKEQLCLHGVQAELTAEIGKEGRQPAKKAGKMIKEKVFPVSVPSGKVLLQALVQLY